MRNQDSAKWDKGKTHMFCENGIEDRSGSKFWCSVKIRDEWDAEVIPMRKKKRRLLLGNIEQARERSVISNQKSELNAFEPSMGSSESKSENPTSPFLRGVNITICVPQHQLRTRSATFWHCGKDSKLGIIGSVNIRLGDTINATEAKATKSNKTCLSFWLLAIVVILYGLALFLYNCSLIYFKGMVNRWVCNHAERIAQAYPSNLIPVALISCCDKFKAPMAIMGADDIPTVVTF
nr:hypothetical protein [Tanacetum cinerariifolium]